MRNTSGGADSSDAFGGALVITAVITERGDSLSRVALSEEVIRAAEEAQAELASKSPEERQRLADWVREMARSLESPKGRAGAESIARYLETEALGAES